MIQNKFEKGDIIFITHRNINGAFNDHPLVITEFNEKTKIINAIGQDALFAAFTLSDAKSNYSKKILSSANLKDVYIPKEINPSPSGKDGVMQIDVLHLFASDVLPTDLKGHIPSEYVDRALKVFEKWLDAGKAKVNVLNLPGVIHKKELDEEEQELKEENNLEKEIQKEPEI